ncbi:MAG: DUF4855 domain-containing protein [Muribaculaceae bacterium]|nr:DUF4855 domain-containing protein [Muribaculaceae bacterium]
MQIHNYLTSLAVAVGLTAATAGTCHAAGRYATDVTSDLALVYAGADTRPEWSVEEVMPFVIHTFADGTKGWFFDAFLILEFHSGSTGIAFQNGLNCEPATRDDWEWLMRRQLIPLASIDSAINIGRATIGEPPLRHKVVMTIPAAIKKQTRPFGQIEGREMDFSKDEDRLAAEKWAVVRLKELFNEADFRNLDLIGIYWVEEGLYTNGAIMPAVNDWIHDQGLRSYWIPYYANNEQFKFNWDKFGFDIAYQQPNYFFDRDIPLSRLHDACAESRDHGMALEMEFESQGKCHVQHSHPDSYYDRLVDYIDVFEQEGVYDNSAVAWYSGTKGFLDMARSDDPKDHELTDRMARIVTRRQAAKAAESKTATVTTGNGTATYRTATPWSGDIAIDFGPAMANDLFTFSNVSMNGNAVNTTSSDNIGPFLLAGRGWSGGNHLNDSRRSAETISVTALADGRPIDLNAAATIPCNTLTIKVKNRLLMPDGITTFANETVTYTARGNSIDVVAGHEFVCPDTVIIDRYYGMQSMFNGETEILTPGGEYAMWTPAGNVDRFTKASAPTFDTFIERSPAGYQATWLDRNTGLGNRDLVDPDDVVFIGNSYGKCYHKTIGNRAVTRGDRTSWHGVYTWFSKPVDSRLDSPIRSFAYAGTCNGLPALFYINASGKTKIIQLSLR